MIPEVLSKAAGHLPARFRKPTDVELNQIVYNSGIRFVIGTACSIDDTCYAQLQDWDQMGKIKLVPVGTETLTPAIADGIFIGSCGENLALMRLQNSGLGHLLDGLSSTNETFRIPAGVWTTIRGIVPEDKSDAHKGIGRLSGPLTKLWFGPDKGKDRAVFGNLDGKGLRGELRKAMGRFAESKNALIRIHPHGFNKTYKLPELKPRPYTTEGLREKLDALDLVRERLFNVWRQTPISREEAHDMIMESITDDTIVVTGNGFDPRALFTRHHRPLNIYGIGNMGGAKQLALGIKLANPFLPVVVIEGDQNAQQGHGGIFNLERCRFPEDQFKAFLLDNGEGASVGGATSLPLALDNFRYSTVIRTIPEQPGQFKADRVEDGLSRRYAGEEDMIATLGPMPAQIRTTMHVIKQKTAARIAKLIAQQELEEKDIPPAFANYKQYAA